jgi:membrane dipeptidase
MKLFDLHCDTLLALGPLAGNQGHIDLDRLPPDLAYCQAFALFIHDRYRGAAAVERGETLYRHFQESLAAYDGQIRQAKTAADIDSILAAGKTAALLTIESAAIFAGDLARIDLMAARGAVLVGLTWNSANELGGGADAPDQGLTPFGREAVAHIEAAGLVVDVSHASDKMFQDVAAVSTKAFIASHSNCRAICPHRRNLTDDQIRQIGERGGIMGLNYYGAFLREDGQPQSWDDLLVHIDHMLTVGGESLPALGSDFDGCTPPPFLRSVADTCGLYEAVCRSSLGEALARRLFFENAAAFFRRQA